MSQVWSRLVSVLIQSLILTTQRQKSFKSHLRSTLMRVKLVGFDIWPERLGDYGLYVSQYLIQPRTLKIASALFCGFLNLETRWAALSCFLFFFWSLLFKILASWKENLHIFQFYLKRTNIVHRTVESTNPVSLSSSVITTLQNMVPASESPSIKFRLIMMSTRMWLNIEGYNFSRDPCCDWSLYRVLLGYIMEFSNYRRGIWHIQ